MAERPLTPSRAVRSGLLFGALLLVLAIVNAQIVFKERILRDGETVLLELAPRDPRSLLQGDYMALRYRMTDAVAEAASDAGPGDGIAIVELDKDGVARFSRLDDGRPLEPGQHRLQFRRRGDSVRIASDAYFFEEGQWRSYSDARYGELRVADDGEAVLVALRDGERRRLGGPLLR